MIHIIKEEDEWSVWSDPDEEPKTGRCIGLSTTSEYDAVRQGIVELQGDLDALGKALRGQPPIVPTTPPCGPGENNRFPRGRW